jgi:hypothetical protein
MATITFDGASAELLQVRQQNPSPVAPISDGARVRVKRFSFTDTAALASGSQIELVEIPGEAVILDTVVSAISLSNSATIEIGTTPKSAPTDDTTDNLLAATAVVAESAPGEKNIALSSGVTSVVGTTGVGALVAGDTLAGYVLYVINT